MAGLAGYESRNLKKPPSGGFFYELAILSPNESI
jgi:hypothetical protein